MENRRGYIRTRTYKIAIAYYYNYISRRAISYIAINLSVRGESRRVAAKKRCNVYALRDIACLSGRHSAYTNAVVSFSDAGLPQVIGSALRGAYYVACRFVVAAELRWSPVTSNGLLGSKLTPPA